MPRSSFVDATIFLQYLTEDTERFKACLALFKQAENNQIQLITTETVIVEVVSVLSSKKYYQLTNRQIHIALSRLLLLPGVKIANRNTILRALALYATSDLPFANCLLLSHMEQFEVAQLYSYDNSFDILHELQRVEPSKEEL